MSGHYKQILTNRSLLTGQEKYITMDMKFRQPFYAMSFVWNILRRAAPQAITENIRGMRTYKGMDGVVFDVPEDQIERFEDIFSHMMSERRVDFDIERAKVLPELKEDDSAGRGGGYGGGGYGGGGGDRYSFRHPPRDSSYQSRPYGGGAGGGYRDQSNGSSFRGGGGGGNRDDDRTVFLGNIGFDNNERDIEEFFRRERLKTYKVRLMKDASTGNSKGAAFVEFENEGDAKRACSLNGMTFLDSRRTVRINPAGNKPSR